MKRTAVNPWPWSLQWNFNQAEVLEGQTRLLVCSGQTSMNADGEPQHANDFAAQLNLTLDNIDAVLKGAGMTFANVVRWNVYTTNIDSYFEHFGLVAERLGNAGVMPPGTLLGVSRLAFPELMIEIEVTAAA
jgi:enamine deaminase RidA (YjgF/YER057c/UK114 family)